MAESAPPGGPPQGGIRTWPDWCAGKNGHAGPADAGGLPGRQRQNGWTSRLAKRSSFLVANVFIVATILASVVGMEPLFSGRELVVSVVAVFILFAIGGVLGWICAKLLPLSPGDRTAAWLSVFFMNNVFIGFPVVEALFGQNAVFCAALTGLPFNLLLFSMGVSRLRAGQGRGRGGSSGGPLPWASHRHSHQHPLLPGVDPLPTAGAASSRPWGAPRCPCPW